ncbi:MAG: ribbon-helix-helix protein, CopG family [Methanocorpusculum sp.]|nr:ribbon-helix-helix protein, CopG family [Methanocorpusculum sp.]
MSQNTLPPISIRVDDSVAEKLSSMAEERGMSRSQLISRALTAFTKSTECIRCGALNAEGSMFCSVCGSPLYSDEEICAAIEDFCCSKPPVKELLAQLTASGLVPSIEGTIDRSSEKGAVRPQYSGVLKVQTRNGLCLKLDETEVGPDVLEHLRVDAGELGKRLYELRMKGKVSPLARTGEIEDLFWADDYEHNRKVYDEMENRLRDFERYFSGAGDDADKIEGKL